MELIKLSQRLNMKQMEIDTMTKDLNALGRITSRLEIERAEAEYDLHELEIQIKKVHDERS